MQEYRFAFALGILNVSAIPFTVERLLEQQEVSYILVKQVSWTKAYLSQLN